MKRTSAAAILLVSAVGCSALSGGEDDKKPGGTPEGVLKVAPIELAFGAVEITSTGEVQSFGLANAGDADVNILGFEMTGAGAGFSLLDAPATLTLGPEQQAEVQVHFLPTVTGEVSGAVHVLSDDPDNPNVRIDLTGSGSNYDGGGTEPLEEGNIDVFILFDTAYSYSCYHPDPESFAHDLIEELFDTFENVAVGLGTYDDYTGLGASTASGGKPYEVRHLVSTDEASLLDAADGLRMNNGGDSWGSGYEAVFQAAWGPGYDQDCDKSFDSSADILPFVSTSDDLFAGSSEQAYDGSVQGVGERGGVGWRDKADHIVLLTADNVFRDDSGGGLPSGSCEAASAEKAMQACNAADVKVLGVNVYEYQSYDSSLQAQLIALAEGTGSAIDKDGDGEADDPAVLYGSWNWPDINQVVEAIRDLSGDL